MKLRKDRMGKCLLILLTISSPYTLSAQERSKLYFAYSADSLKAGLEPPQERGSVGITDCDSDFDGALWGTLIGLSPVAIAIISTDPEPTGMLIAGIVGAIAGFWIGLAVDSAHPDDCDVQERRSARAG